MCVEETVGKKITREGHGFSNVDTHEENIVFIGVDATGTKEHLVDRGNNQGLQEMGHDKHTGNADQQQGHFVLGPLTLLGHGGDEALVGRFELPVILPRDFDENGVEEHDTKYGDDFGQSEPGPGPCLEEEAVGELAQGRHSSFHSNGDVIDEPIRTVEEEGEEEDPNDNGFGVGGEEVRFAL